MKTFCQLSSNVYNTNSFTDLYDALSILGKQNLQPTFTYKIIQVSKLQMNSVATRKKLACILTTKYLHTIQRLCS